MGDQLAIEETQDSTCKDGGRRPGRRELDVNGQTPKKKGYEKTPHK